MVRTRRSNAADDGSRCRPPSRLCSPRKFVVIQRGFRPPATRCSLGLTSLQGLHCPRLAPRFTRCNSLEPRRPRPANDRSRGLVPDAAPRSVPARKLAVLSRDRLPLLRFPTLSRYSTVRKQRGPELMGSPRVPSHVTALSSNPIRATAPLQPKLERKDVNPCFLPESVN
jgi:hypothetical protein